MLTEMELYQAELMHAVLVRDEAKKRWERWATYLDEKVKEQIYSKYEGGIKCHQKSRLIRGLREPAEGAAPWSFTTTASSATQTK